MNNSIKTAQSQAGLDFAHTGDSRPTALNRTKKFILTLLALLTITTGAWAQTVVTWDTNTWADTNSWKYGVNTHTVDGVTITVGGDALVANSDGNLYLYVTNAASETITFSADAPFNRIEFTNVNAWSSLSVSTLDGWSVSSDGTTVTWEGEATKSLVCETCTLYVSKIKFFLEEAGPEVTLNTDSTEATMTMPASDVTVSYELVRDLAVSTHYEGVPTEPVVVKKDGDKYVFATFDPTAVQIVDELADNAVISAGTTYGFELKNENGDFETAEGVSLLTNPQPGTWRIVTKATDDGNYGGETHSREFTLVEQYDLTLQPADDGASRQGISEATVGGQPVTLTDDGAATTTAQPGQKVVIKAKPGYVIEEVKVEKPAAPVTYTELKGGEVLHVGDIIDIANADVAYSINMRYNLKKAWGPYTVLRANITGEEDDPTITPATDGAYYVLQDSGDFYHFRYKDLPATATSDGISVTKGSEDGNLWTFTFTVHEP